MPNFIGLVYATLKKHGIDTSRMSTQEAIKKYNELQGQGNNQNASKEDRISRLKKQMEEAKGIMAKAKILNEINALEEGFDNVDDYLKEKERKRQEAVEKSEKRKKELEEQKKKEMQEKMQKLKNDMETATEFQKKQFDIISQFNPMLDDYHTGIRSPKEIKTFEETLEDEDSFVWGDFSREDAKEAVKKGKVTVYSSYPIKQGVFISTSRVQAEEYAGGRGGKVYSMEIPLNEVAWINGDEGQYAKVED